MIFRYSALTNNDGVVILPFWAERSNEKPQQRHVLFLIYVQHAYRDLTHGHTYNLLANVHPLAINSPVVWPFRHRNGAKHVLPWTVVTLVRTMWVQAKRASQAPQQDPSMGEFQRFHSRKKGRNQHHRV